MHVILDSINDQFYSLIQEKILASLEAKIPVLTPREVHVPGLRGKAMVVIGMRRSGKTTDCDPIPGD
jgi:hypothetical protein